MDTGELIPTLKAKAPGAVLESRPFGRSGEASLWIEMKSVAKVARILADEESLSFDWLENLSAMELEGALVLTYFLRSSATGARLVLRGSVVPASADAEADAVSVCGAWPMAAPMEAEIGELFGVRFKGGPPARRILPEGWEGYPLRKSYLFPTEFYDIPHARPAGHASPDEHGPGKAEVSS